MHPAETFGTALSVVIIFAAVVVALLLCYLASALWRLIVRTLRGDFDKNPETTIIKQERRR